MAETDTRAEKQVDKKPIGPESPQLKLIEKIRRVVREEFILMAQALELKKNGAGVCSWIEGEFKEAARSCLDATSLKREMQRAFDMHIGLLECQRIDVNTTNIMTGIRQTICSAFSEHITALFNKKYIELEDFGDVIECGEETVAPEGMRFVQIDLVSGPHEISFQIESVEGSFELKELDSTPLA
ncbi:MAG: hypothetical protein ABIH35_04635 [Patescibacteria group bacterium]